MMETFSPMKIFRQWQALANEKFGQVAILGQWKFAKKKKKKQLEFGK